jgi:probable rRNA maturation factor
VDPDIKRLRVSVTDDTGRPVRDGGLGAWLAANAPARATGEVGVALVNDAEVRRLNRRYRRIDSPTDVLSFSGSDSGHFSVLAGPHPRSRALGGAASRRFTPSPRAGRGPRHLGDIAIATGVARRQAREAGHSFQAELRVLALHGLLHLLGYDHHDARASGRMTRLETRLRRRGGLRSALLERTGARPATRRART